MEVLVAYENGNRFAARCGDYVITAGRGDDGDTARDGMEPDQLFLASLGACIGVYVLGYCRHHGIPHHDLRVEVSRETARSPSRTTRIAAAIRLGAALSEEHAAGILRVAEQCHVHQSIRLGVEVGISVAETG